MVKEGTPEENWTTVFTTGYDYEAELVRDRLDDSGIPAVIYNKKDHAFNLTVGDLAPIAVNVPNERADEALALLADSPLTDQELDDAAMDSGSPEDHENLPDPQYVDPPASEPPPASPLTPPGDPVT